MNNLFYPKLALSNIKKNLKLFFPYILMNVGIIAMYFIMHSLSVDPGIKDMRGGNSLQMLLSFGTIVIAIFSSIFIFYTNSFLSKRRKKEIGLYNILGMGKRHIGHMLFIETLFIALICLAFGLITGIVLNKLMILVLLKLLQVSVKLKFILSIKSILSTILLFSIVFLVTLIFNLGTIHLSNPIELLKGGNTGEREPKTKWIMTLIGILTLGAGYYIAQVVESPIEALGWFFVAVVLVMIGTYCLFTSGSIAILKILKKNKKLYYRSNHFTSISGMIYRMKQNAVGLANICILSTAVLVTLSTTLSLYVGLEDVLKNQFPHDIKISTHDTESTNTEAMNLIIDKEASLHNVEIVNRSEYNAIGFTATNLDNTYTPTENISNWSDIQFITLIPLEDYNRNYNDSIELKANEVLLTTSADKYNYSEIVIGEQVLKVAKELPTVFDYNKTTENLVNNITLIVSSKERMTELYKEWHLAAYTDHETSEEHYKTFDIQGTDEARKAFNDSFYNAILDNNSSSLTYSSGISAKEEFISLHGGLFFIGIFLGFLFLMATVIIIYYKQISEGYDDKVRFEIMQKVGMSPKEIKHTIKTQILMVFFLPLIFAVIHICFAFHVITKLIALFGFMNTPLFFLCTVATIIVFALIYLIVYTMTARVYYKIVK